MHCEEKTPMANTEILSETEWSAVVRARLGDSAVFKLLDVSAGPLGDQVVGFVGDHLRVQVIIQLLDNKRNILKFFVKRIPEENEFQNEYVLSTESFPKETAFFFKVVQHFRRHGLSEQSPWAAECYFTRPDILVMEDLIEQGFTLHEKSKHMDYSHCATVLKNLANLHACSIVVEEKETKLSGKVYKLNDEYSDLLFENLFVNSGNNLAKYWLRSSIKALTSLVPFLPNYGTHSKLFAKVLEKIPGSFENLFSLLKPSDKYRNVICHGDLWCNNILFRYGNDKHTPEEARLVDFQMYRYTPPAVDVISFLHLTTSRAFRTLHKDRLLRVYHENLSQELKRNGYEVDHVLPWQRFLQSCCHYGTLGRMMAGIYLHLSAQPDEVLSSGINSPDGYHTFLLHDRDKEVLRAFNTDAAYKFRMTEALEELIECDVLKQ